MDKKLLEKFESLFQDKPPKNLYEPVLYVLEQGGKRLRPRLVLLATEIFGGNVDDALYTAAAFEMMHNFTLIHDDIMDDAPIRRGKETVYKKWNPNIAILAGDALATMALVELLKTPISKEALHVITNVFAKTSIEICEGQQMDIDFETSDNVSIEEYTEMIRLKTAVMLAGCLKSGAIIANATEEEQENIYQFGIYIGLAFQLMDDWLDVYGEEETFGKRIGGDIDENKKTYPYLLALSIGNEEQVKLLKELFATSEISSEEKFNKVTAVFEALNISNLTKKAISDYIDKAIEIATALDIPNDKQTLITAEAEKLRFRLK